MDVFQTSIIQKKEISCSKNGVKSLFLEDTLKIGMEYMDHSDRENTGRLTEEKKEYLYLKHHTLVLFFYRRREIISHRTIVR
jgi:hypothetical protein